jgi:hypothetical protein
MAFYRSRRKPPSDDRPPLAAVERELQTEDRNNLKILAIIALFIAVGFWIYSQTNDAAVTDVQPPAAPVEQTTTGAAEPALPTRPEAPAEDRALETPIPPRGPHPTEQ